MATFASKPTISSMPARLHRSRSSVHELVGILPGLAELKEFNGEADHVHLLVHYPPKVALAGLVNSLKGVSSRRLRAEFTGRVNRAIMHGRFWSPSYFAGSLHRAAEAPGLSAASRGPGKTVRTRAHR